jgi:hypothetical protein
MGQKFTEISAGPTPGSGGGSATMLPISGGAASSAAKVGEAVVNFGEKLRAAKTRSDNVLNTVRRSRAFKEFNGLIAGEMSRIELEEDVTNPNLPSQFGAFMKEQHNRIMGEHRDAGADGASMGKLAARFIDLQGVAAGKVGGILAKQRRGLVEEDVAAQIGALAVSAGVSGDAVGGYDDVRGIVFEAEDTFTAVQEDVKILAGYAAVTTEIFNVAAEVENVEAMTAALDYVDAKSGVTAKDALGPKAYRTLRNRVVQIEYDRDKGAREAIQLKAKVGGILGVDASNLDLADGDTRQLLGMDRDDTEPGVKSMSAAVALYTKATGIEGADIPPEDLQRMQLKVMENMGLDLGDGTKEDKGPFGTGLRGRSKNHIVDLAPLFASGDIKEGSREERIWTSSVLELQRRYEIGKNPITNEPIFAQGTLPPYAVDAYKRRGITIPRPSSITGETADSAPLLGSGVKPGAVEGEGVITLFDGTKIDPNNFSIAPNQTLYGRLDKVTGIGTGIKVGLAESVIGGALGFTAVDEINARKDLELFSTKVANAMTVNTKIRAATEREHIIEQMDMLPTLEAKESLRPKMFAVADLIISTILKDAATLIGLSDPVSMKAAQNEIRSLNFVLQQLGVPRLVKTKADLKGIPVGTLVRTPSNQVYTIKEASDG